MRWKVHSSEALDDGVHCDFHLTTKLELGTRNEVNQLQSWKKRGRRTSAGLSSLDAHTRAFLCRILVHGLYAPHVRASRVKQG